MDMSNLYMAARRDVPPICPGCGQSDCDDNRLDTRLYEVAASEVPRLKFEGQVDDVIDILTALSAVCIANYIRPRWRCVCGVQFDG